MITPSLHEDDIDLLFRSAAAPAIPAQRSPSVGASFRFAGAGLSHFLRTQRNARIHLAVAALVTGLAFWLGLPGLEIAVLWLTIAIVLVAEALNTALEAVVDLVTESYHPLARTAKDTAAGAVLLAAIGSVAVGAVLLAPPLLGRIVSILV